LLTAVVKGKNPSQAAIAAGYSPKNPDVSGAVAMAQLRRKVPDVLVRMGLYPEKV
jgi:phage terminase small subunit